MNCNVLLIEDDPKDVLLLFEMLSTAGRHFRSEKNVDRLAGGLDRISNGGLDEALYQAKRRDRNKVIAV